MSEAKRARIDPLKIVFALGYVMQGLANPFQGITTLSFLRHLQQGYGLGEGEASRLFAKSYLAWSFKPIIGFLVDAYGRTRTILIGLLGLAALGYLLTPLRGHRADGLLRGDVRRFGRDGRIGRRHRSRHRDRRRRRSAGDRPIRGRRRSV